MFCKYFLNFYILLLQSPDPRQHIHVIWYVIDNPNWCNMDEQYCDGLLRRAAQYRLPVIVVINKVILLQFSLRVTQVFGVPVGGQHGS